MDANPQQMVAADFDELESGASLDVQQGGLQGSAPAIEKPPLSLLPLHHVPVRVQALLGRAQLTIDQLLELAVGSVVELDRRAGEPVDLLVNGRLIARGELVLVDGQLGVTLTELLTA